MKKIIAFLKKKDLYLGIVRYGLALNMLPYAITKILRTQFIVLPFAAWQQPLEKLSSHTLAWAFLGYSPWFQVLLGFLELVPALLLLFRRTTLTGAILMLPVTLNVYLINMALNLWDTTKTISLVLLLLNCLVFVFEWKRVKEIVLIVIGKIRLKFTIWELVINIVIIGFVVNYNMGSLLDYKSQKNILTGDWLNQHPYEWILSSEKLKDSTLPPRVLKSYFGAYGAYSERTDTGFIKSGNTIYTLDERKKQLNFFKNGTLVNKCTYKLVGDTLLQVNREVDSVWHTTVVQVFKKRVINSEKKS